MPTYKYFYQRDFYLSLFSVLSLNDSCGHITANGILPMKVNFFQRKYLDKPPCNPLGLDMAAHVLEETKSVLFTIEMCAFTSLFVQFLYVRILYLLLSRRPTTPTMQALIDLSMSPSPTCHLFSLTRLSSPGCLVF